MSLHDRKGLSDTLRLIGRAANGKSAYFLAYKRSKQVCGRNIYMNIGYARVSTADQTLNLQKDALLKLGCTKIFTDTASGAKAERTGLNEAMEYVREGDTLVVWRLDRLGRSLKHLIETISQLDTRKIGFKSLTENIDTTTSGGKLIFHIFGALAEFERNLIRERTNAGLQAARARGRKGGRPKALTPKKAQMVQDLYRNKDNSIDEICKTLNISRATLYRYIKIK
jgi:DNA invertase Pin-like site-specific DNA recombinase